MATDAAQLVALLEPFGHEWLQIIAPHRRVTHEFDCWLVTPAGGCDARGVLLGDLLLLCKKEREKERRDKDKREAQAGEKPARLRPQMLLRLRDLLRSGLAPTPRHRSHAHGPSRETGPGRSPAPLSAATA